MSEAANQVPDWAIKPDQTYPAWPGTPRQYRFDGEKGVFAVGTEIEKTELWVQIFDHQWTEGERWHRDNQNWLDLAFVDDDHIVSILALKKGAAVNMADFLAQVQSGRKLGMPVRIEALWVKLVPKAKQTAEGETYYTVVVDSYNFAQPEQMTGVIRFRMSGQFDWVYAGEIEVDPVSVARRAMR